MTHWPARSAPPHNGDGSGMLLILSAPRSGSTWLGKIFDSHPDVCYRHEPDTVLRIETALDPARDDGFAAYAARLARLRHLKSAGHTPLFAKRHRGKLRGLARSAIVHGLRAAEHVPGLRPLAMQASIPDWHERRPRLTVVKSVSACRFAGAYRDVLPRAYILLLMREPFGQIASLLRGARDGRLDVRAAVEGLWEWPRATDYGLTSARFKKLSLAEQLAWHWVILNETALGGLGGRAGTFLLHYHDLLTDPVNQSLGLFSTFGLHWHTQTAAFIERSTHFSGEEGFYRVFRNAERPDRDLRSLLHPDDRARIMDVVGASTLRLWALRDYRALKLA